MPEPKIRRKYEPPRAIEIGGNAAHGDSTEGICLPIGSSPGRTCRTGLIFISYQDCGSGSIVTASCVFGGRPNQADDQ